MIFKRARRRYVIDLEDRLARSAHDLELETSRRQRLQQNELAVTEARDTARAQAKAKADELAVALDRVGILLETRDRLMAERDEARDAVANMGYGIHAIHGERMTHTSEHDYDADRDDAYSYHQLAMAAAVYAAPFEVYEHTEPRPGEHRFELAWPWAETAEPKIERPLLPLANPVPAPEGSLAERVRRRDARIHELAKAGSLVAAEIDRIVRLGSAERTAPGRERNPILERLEEEGRMPPGRVPGSELGPGPGRDHGGSLYADDEAGGAPR